MSIQDFEAVQDNGAEFDMTIDYDNADFGSVEGLETAIDFQLFTDQRVSKSEVARKQDRKGWVGDMLTRNKGYQVGSILFLKEQSRDTFLDRNEIAAHSKNSLEYLVSIGASKEVTARVIGKNIEGTIVNDDNEISRYNRLWRATNAT
jgi:phage gp46-like protein